jgi:hypothetical protein
LNRPRAHLIVKRLALTFPTREGCQKWVQERSRQPGFQCFDGCNWRQCNDAGDGMDSTLLACSVSVVPYVHFEPGTSKPSHQLDWAGMVTQFKIALRPRERRLIVVGYAEASEAASAAAVTRLAELRAKTIVQQLVKHGLDPNASSAGWATWKRCAAVALRSMRSVCASNSTPGRECAMTTSQVSANTRSFAG